MKWHTAIVLQKLGFHKQFRPEAAGVDTQLWAHRYTLPRKLSHTGHLRLAPISQGQCCQCHILVSPGQETHLAFEYQVFKMQ